MCRAMARRQKKRDRNRYASQGEVRQITPRYKMHSLYHLVFVMLTMMSLTAMAEIGVPPRASWVTDLTGTLNAEEGAALEARLTDFTATKGAQVALLFVPSTEGEPIESFAL